MLRWIIFLLIFIAIDIYAFQAFKTITKNGLAQFSYWVMSLIVLGNFIFMYFGFNRSDGFSQAHGYAFAFLITLFLPKAMLLVMMLGEDVFRLFEGIFNKFSGSTTTNGSMFEGRRKFVSQIALGIAAIPFTSFIYGISKGKYNFKVLNYNLYYEDLPDAFDGYRITQISDIHSGSFDSIKKVDYAIDLINQQESDTIVFTGDMVNNKAEEMHPYVDIFKKLKAKDGMYSVLGNHDYGDYLRWETEEAKSSNLNALKDLQKDIGFDLLLNEHRFIEKNGERIAIIGVENWGKGGFKKAGDLNAAISNIDKDDFKILLSHDPSHWEAEVVDHDLHYHLTLSGHTHGMQFGIEIPGIFKWSPVKWRYKQWAGIYEKFGQYINVNRGFGYLAFPGRVGIWPEITVIELKKGLKPS
ncbi:MAG: metallophosphoesterase [Bacteroidia bacterium]|nr:metallophosphoesterase [Bacteroidia bacterium]NND25013.1 metallophosphoesterase [Flavobacteriaceae bacterium]MBT8278567.1 metallophosphoesterase [Bacteroidia bacterium]NNK59539.1 metallophosphoesterase [Flavobacteriaceae bacterium]NNL32496.1 metallophosphoesterase [Flavobacteriaceae bacterium]